MPTPYQLALLFVRLGAAMSIMVGLFSLGSAIVSFALSVVIGSGFGDLLSSLLGTLLTYGIFYLMIGILQLVFAKPLARFAAKAIEG